MSGKRPLLVPQESPHHPIGKTGVVAEPGREELNQGGSRVRVAGFDQRYKLSHPLTDGVMLLLVPLERFVMAAAHQAFFVREMVFGTGDQAVQNFLDLKERRRLSKGLLKLFGYAKDRSVLVVDFRNEHCV